MSNQELFLANCNLWLSHEKKIKSLCHYMVFNKILIDDVMSEAKLIFTQSNTNTSETISTWYLRKTILLACRKLGYYRPKIKTSDSNQLENEKYDSFESLNYLSESTGFDPRDERYDRNEYEERISELLESVEASPIFQEAVKRIEAGASLTEVAASFGVSASGLWQRLRSEGKKIMADISSPQMRLIQGAEIQKKGFDQGEYKKAVQKRFAALRTPKTSNSQMELF